MLLVAGLLVVAAFSGCILPWNTTSEPTEHLWRITLQPENPGPHELEVPFLVPHQGDEKKVKALDALKARLSAPAGTRMQWLDDPEGYLKIDFQGPVVVEAKRTITNASIGEHEAFLDWRIAGQEATLVAGGPVKIDWTIAFTAYSCWADAEFQVTLLAEGTIPLPDDAWIRRACT